MENETKAYEQTKTGDKLSLLEIEHFAKNHFPLCMQMVHRHLTENSHLKHDGRLQYTLFLKGCGLTMEESLNFFKKKFSKTTPEDKFEKEYSYNIRHSYGQEGKRVDYPPYNCKKIQNMKLPSAGEIHGCPFKIFNEEKMKRVLVEQGIKELDIIRIMEKKKSNEYSVACMRHFEARHHNDNQAENVGIAPSGYFNSSIEYNKRIRTGNKEKPKVKIGYEETKNNNNNVSTNNNKNAENKMDIC